MFKGNIFHKVALSRVVMEYNLILSVSSLDLSNNGFTKKFSVMLACKLILPLS